MNAMRRHCVWKAAAAMLLLNAAEAGAQQRVPVAGLVWKPRSVVATRERSGRRGWPGRKSAQPANDAWLGRDKLRHFGSSAAIQLLGYGSLRVMGASRGASMLVATVVTGAAGVGKEVHDSRRGGRASARDLVWDGAGALAGIGLARLGDPR